MPGIAHIECFREGGFMRTRPRLARHLQGTIKMMDAFFQGALGKPLSFIIHLFHREVQCESVRAPLARTHTLGTMLASWGQRVWEQDLRMLSLERLTARTSLPESRVWAKQKRALPGHCGHVTATISP